MRVNRKAMLAAGLLAGAAAMTGCTAAITPAATPTPKAAQQATAQPATAQPEASASPEAAEGAMEDEMKAGEETPAPLSLIVQGEKLGAQAIEEDGRLLLPIEETAQALGYKASRETAQEENGEKRTITLDKDDSRITVSWSVSDNTVKGISWQKDGLLIPVDTQLKTVEDIVYAPAAFFEEAMDARIKKADGEVVVTLPEPAETPAAQEQDVGENG